MKKTLLFTSLLLSLLFSHQAFATHCQIHGKVYRDGDASRTTLGDTTALAGIKINLTRNGSPFFDSSQTILTNSSGSFSFNGLPGGTYLITILLPTAFDTVDANAGQYVEGTGDS